MTKTDKELEIERYLKEVEIFNKVRAKEAEQLVEEKKGNILYIGRETCPYCRKFVHKLSPLAEEYDLQVNYLHSRQPDHQEAIDALRDKYDVPTVPGLLYSSEEKGIVVKCDSSLSPEEILEIVEVAE